MKYVYAVARGRKPGIYESWPECLKQVHGYANARCMEKGKNNKSGFDKHSRKLGPVKNVVAEQWISDGVPVVYTDGSCMSNGMKGRCKAGFGVFWGDNHPDNLSEPLHEGPPTNNRAELTAVIRALQQAEKKGYKRLVVKTDSNLLIQSMNVWIHSWRKNNWKTSTGSDVKNKDLLVELDMMLKKVQVCFDHIRGHVGIYGNEKADELARAGAQLYCQQ
uniref:ribonuclease H n=1 Tax=Syphacia muris TaxID=451379 RepID=A0A0N5ANA2_9BILA